MRSAALIWAAAISIISLNAPILTYAATPSPAYVPAHADSATQTVSPKHQKRVTAPIPTTPTDMVTRTAYSSWPSQGTTETIITTTGLTVLITLVTPETVVATGAVTLSTSYTTWGSSFTGTITTSNGIVVIGVPTSYTTVIYKTPATLPSGQTYETFSTSRFGNTVAYYLDAAPPISPITTVTSTSTYGGRSDLLLAPSTDADGLTAYQILEVPSDTGVSPSTVHSTRPGTGPSITTITSTATDGSTVFIIVETPTGTNAATQLTGIRTVSTKLPDGSVLTETLMGTEQPTWATQLTGIRTVSTKLPDGSVLTETLIGTEQPTWVTLSTGTRTVFTTMPGGSVFTDILTGNEQPTWATQLTGTRTVFTTMPGGSVLTDILTGNEQPTWATQLTGTRTVFTTMPGGSVLTDILTGTEQPTWVTQLTGIRTVSTKLPDGSVLTETLSGTEQPTWLDVVLPTSPWTGIGTTTTTGADGEVYVETPGINIVSYTTVTADTSWNGTSTRTETSIDGSTVHIIIETPGRAAVVDPAPGGTSRATNVPTSPNASTPPAGTAKHFPVATSDPNTATNTGNAKQGPASTTIPNAPTSKPPYSKTDLPGITTPAATIPVPATVSATGNAQSVHQKPSPNPNPSQPPGTPPETVLPTGAKTNNNTDGGITKTPVRVNGILSSTIFTNSFGKITKVIEYVKPGFNPNATIVGLTTPTSITSNPFSPDTETGTPGVTVHPGPGTAGATVNPGTGASGLTLGLTHHKPPAGPITGTGGSGNTFTAESPSTFAGDTATSEPFRGTGFGTLVQTMLPTHNGTGVIGGNPITERPLGTGDVPTLNPAAASASLSALETAFAATNTDKAAQASFASALSSQVAGASAVIPPNGPSPTTSPHEPPTFNGLEGSLPHSFPFSTPASNTTGGANTGSPPATVAATDTGTSTDYNPVHGGQNYHDKPSASTPFVGHSILPVATLPGTVQTLNIPVTVASYTPPSPAAADGKNNPVLNSPAPVVTDYTSTPIPSSALVMTVSGNTSILQTHPITLLVTPTGTSASSPSATTCFDAVQVIMDESWPWERTATLDTDGMDAQHWLWTYLPSGLEVGMNDWTESPVTVLLHPVLIVVNGQVESYISTAANVQIPYGQYGSLVSELFDPSTRASFLTRVGDTQVGKQYLAVIEAIANITFSSSSNVGCSGSQDATLDRYVVPGGALPSAGLHFKVTKPPLVTGATSGLGAASVVALVAAAGAYRNRKKKRGVSQPSHLRASSLSAELGWSKASLHSRLTLDEIMEGFVEGKLPPSSDGGSYRDRQSGGAYSALSGSSANRNIHYDLANVKSSLGPF